MLRRPGLDPPRYAVQALVQEAAQRPAGTVASQHVEVVDVQVGLTVGLSDLRTVHLVQPVIGSDLAGDVENQPAQGIALVGIGLHPPVLPVEVFVHRRRHVHQVLAVTAQPAVALAVDDVGTCGGVVSAFHQYQLDLVLHLLDIQTLQPRQTGQHGYRQCLGLVGGELSGGQACRQDGALDLGFIERDFAAIALEQGPWPGHRFPGTHSHLQIATYGVF
ncbi:hypothetical protein D9M68_389480 [compost metagenome]